MNSITTDNGIQLTDGTVVMLGRYPGVKWIVKNGWYSYQGSQYTGWYFCSIPSQTTIPILEEDLTLITVISQPDGCNCNPGRPMPYPPYPPEPPCPCPPDHNHHPTLSEDDKYQIDRSFITVNTLEDRDKLTLNKIVPDGKIVRVNSVRGSIKYYSYNLENKAWDEITIEQDTARIENIEEKVSNMEKSISWLNINKEVIE